MSNEPREQLVALLEAHRVILHSDGVSWTCQQCPDRRYHSYFPHDASREHQAEVLLSLGWRPPPRTLETPEAIAAERTGTVIRSRHGDIGSIDHGPHGDWVGPGTLVHMLDPGVGLGLSVADLMDPELASTFPYLVLWEPKEADQ